MISSAKKKGALVGGCAGAAAGGAGAGIPFLFFGAAGGPIGIAAAALVGLVVGAIAGGYVGRCNGISASEAYIDEVIKNRRHNLFYDLPSQDKDIYKKCCAILNVSESATPAAIKARFRNKVSAFHADKTDADIDDETR